MQLSIIVPVYNMAAGGKLNYCMDSLLNQTISDYEIIAVNDASTDNSLEILRKYEEKFPKRVKVVTYGENKRQGGAKNQGLKVACGQWVGFIDSDDWVAPDYYEKLLKRAEQTGADVVSCDYSLVSEHSMKVGKIVSNHLPEQYGVLDEDKYKSLIMRSGSMVIKIFKRQILVDNHLDFPEGIFYEDNCAAPVWMLYFTHFEKVDEPLYYYYQHTASTVHVITEDKCRDRLSAANQMLLQMKDRGFFERYRTQIEFRYIELFYVITLFSYMAGARKPRYTFVKNIRKEAVANFPDFASNPYYIKYIGAEEKKLIAMQQKSDLLFFVYYKLLQKYRNFRKKLCN